jgi:GNAT superfamily N-acetyltransferase
MLHILELQRDNFIISTDLSRIDVDAMAVMLARSYWANDRSRKQLECALEHSLVFGLYDASHQIGLARIISDFAIFAYLCDVFIHEDYRGRGLGKWLMETVHNHPDLQGLRRWLLATRDAHGLYSRYGWVPLNTPDRWMEKFSG